MTFCQAIHSPDQIATAPTPSITVRSGFPPSDVRCEEPVRFGVQGGGGGWGEQG